MKIVSLNAWGGAMYETLAAWLPDSGAVAALLPHHQGVLAVSDSGPVHDEHGHRHQQDFGIAMFVHERFPIIGQRTAYVHGTYVDHREWPTADRPRIAQATRIVPREPGRILTIAHLHGLRDPAGKHDTAGRSAQAERLADVITARTRRS